MPLEKSCLWKEVSLWKKACGGPRVRKVVKGRPLEKGKSKPLEKARRRKSFGKKARRRRKGRASLWEKVWEKARRSKADHNRMYDVPGERARERVMCFYFYICFIRVDVCCILVPSKLQAWQPVCILCLLSFFFTGFTHGIYFAVCFGLHALLTSLVKGIRTSRWRTPV